MLYGRKLLDYHQSMKRIKQLVNRFQEIEQEKEKVEQEHQVLISQINHDPKQILTNDEVIERMLTEQKLFLLEKDLVLKHEKWMREAFEIMQEQQELENKLEHLKSNIPEPFWEQYKQKQELFENPVVEVKHYMCTGCFIPLSKPSINRWRQGKELVTCEVCDRILV